MIDQRIEELMWQRIDGTISPEDSADLDAHIGAHLEARSYFDELTSMSSLLDHADDVEPPADLRQRIEGAIEWDRYPQQAAGFDWRTFFAPWWDLRIATAAVAGILIGVIAYSTMINRFDTGLDLANEDVSGSMALSKASTAVLDSPGVDGIVTFRRNDLKAISDVKIDSDREVEIILEYDGQSTLFRAQSDSGSPLGSIVVEGNTVRVTHYGPGRYIAVFRPAASADAPLMVRILADGDVLLEEEVRPRD